MEFLFLQKGGSEKFHHHFTLLDGEMVIDTLPDKKLERRYLVYDMMTIHHNSLVEVMFGKPFFVIFP